MTKLTNSIATLCLLTGCPEEPHAGIGTPYELETIDPGPASTGEMWECDIASVPAFIDPKQLTALLGAVYVLSEGDREALERMCAEIKETYVEPIRHSTGYDYPPDLEKRWAALVAKYWERWEVEIRGSGAHGGDEEFRVAQSAIDAAYPCGETPERVTLCGQTRPMPEGPIAMLAMIADAAIPPADPTHSHQYGFVFDADGDPTNNYLASPQYPNDFFDGTDLWIQAMYEPSTGWTLSTVSAAGGVVQPIASDARVIIEGNTLIALVPMAELGDQTCPEHRMTAFTHLGDWGLEEPHVWMGDAEPPIEEGLEGTCR